MSYREYPPSPELAPYVDCFWSRSASPRGRARVLPDGAVDFLFTFHPGGGAASHVVGTMTRALLVTGWSPVVAVRFRPGGLRPWLGLSMAALTDRRVELARLVPHAHRWSLRIGLETSTSGRIRRLETILGEAFSGSPSPDERVVAAVRSIQGSKGRIAVGDLSRELGLSRQHLTRLFERDVGIGVKAFGRVARMQSVVASLGLRDRRPSFAELALDAGYYDQAHFTTDFHALVGLTPGRFVARSISPRRARSRRSTLSA